MALFSRNKKEDQKETVAAKSTPVANVATRGAQSTDRDLSGVILKPRITEKAVGQGEKNVYTFIVRQDATKHDVRDAVQALFKVTPVKVNIVNKTPRSFVSRTRGRRVSQPGMKKAYVYLKAGDSIELA